MNLRFCTMHKQTNNDHAFYAITALRSLGITLLWYYYRFSLPNNHFSFFSRKTIAFKFPTQLISSVVCVFVYLALLDQVPVLNQIHLSYGNARLVKLQFSLKTVLLVSLNRSWLFGLRFLVLGMPRPIVVHLELVLGIHLQT